MDNYEKLIHMGIVMNSTIDSEELQHAGVKGMKWGVRRYQNKDGSLTDAGKKRYNQNSESGESEKSSNRAATAKKVAGVAIATATVATAAAIYAKNPEAVNAVVGKAANVTMSTLKTGKTKAVEAGKAYVKTSIEGMKEGFNEGMKEAPKKAAKAVVTGIVMNAAKRSLDSAVGKEEAARIFKANNNKKIDSFWKVGPEDKDDD